MNDINSILLTDEDVAKGTEIILNGEDVEKGGSVKQVVLTWRGESDLDLGAIMLDENKNRNSKEDVVYFNSLRRWKTEKPIGASDFDVLKGKPCYFEDEKSNYKNTKKFKDATLPLSPDDSVIGSSDDLGGVGEHVEVMHIRFDEVSSEYSYIAIIAALSEEDVKKGKTFSAVSLPNLTIYDVDDASVAKQAEYQLNRDYGRYLGICVGFMKYNDDSDTWSFLPSATGYKGGIKEIANSFVKGYSPN